MLQETEKLKKAEKWGSLQRHEPGRRQLGVLFGTDTPTHICRAAYQRQ